MCYSYITVYSNNSDAIYKVQKKEYLQLVKDGVIVEDGEKPYFAKSNVPVIIGGTDGNHLAAMHWDLIPRWYKAKENLSLHDVIKAKNSKGEGFHSYNARAEDIASKPSYRSSWKEGKRCIFPGVVAFKERPNRKDTPSDFAKREYEIKLREEVCFAGIYDVWKNQDGIELASASVITIDGTNHPIMQSIWHGRQPAILTVEQALKYIAPDTSAEEAYRMLVPFPPEKMVVSA